VQEYQPLVYERKCNAW